MISTSIIKHLSDALHHTVIHKPKKAGCHQNVPHEHGESGDVNSRGNTGRKAGQALEEKHTFEDLKSEALTGHIQMGRNGSLMWKRYRTRKEDLELSLGQDNRTQKSCSLTTAKILGKGFMNKADSKAHTQFSTRKKVYMPLPKKKNLK